MIKFLIAPVLLLIAAIIGLSIYLQPNDLSRCKGEITGEGPCQVVDAIVVVSGGDTNARTDEGIDLYQKGWAKVLIFSGAARDKTGLSNAAAMKTRALEAGVPESAIYIDEEAESTIENAENTATIFNQLSVKRVILVTSGYHMRRASMEFNRRAGDVVIYNKPVESDKDWSAWWWLTPRGWYLAVSEFFKSIISNSGVR